MTKETDFLAFEQYIDHQLRDKRLLEGVKDVIVAIKTAKRELLDAREAADKAIAEKDVTLKDLKEAKDNLDKAKAKIKKAEESANEEASLIIAEAKSQANQILAKAVLDADKQKQESAKAKADLEKTNSDISLVKADLAKHEEALAAVKAKFAALAG